MIASFGTAYGPGMRCVIVVPTYHEAGAISALLGRLFAVVPVTPGDPRLDVLVVDDSSPDGTGEIARAIIQIGATETTSDGYGFQVENTWTAERAGAGSSSPRLELGRRR